MSRRNAQKDGALTITTSCKLQKKKKKKKKQGTNRRSISMQAKIINQNSEMRGYDAFLSKPLRLRHR